MPIADFNQSQREALIRLLIGATYGDSYLSLDETEAYLDMIDVLPWDSGTDIDLFQDEATSDARAAHEADQLEDYIREQATAFETPATQATALDLLVHLLDSDGTTSEEGKLIAVAKHALS